MKFTVIAIVQTPSALLTKIEKLPKENLIYFMEEKLKQPFAKYSQEGKDQKFDAWEIFDVLSTKELLKVIDQFDRFPDQIFMPDCTWVTSPEAFFSVTETNQRKFDLWVQTVKNILEEYSENSFSLIITCHI